MLRLVRPVPRSGLLIAARGLTRGLAHGKDVHDKLPSQPPLSNIGPQTHVEGHHPLPARPEIAHETHRVGGDASGSANGVAAGAAAAAATAAPRVTLAQRIVDALPARWQPYARLSRVERPIGTWLLYSPCTWSLTVAATMTAAPLTTTAYYMAVFLVGAWLTRGAGCTINDIWDRNLDNSVDRTKTRPLAARAVTVPQATTWLGVQGAASLGVLYSLPRAAWAAGALSVVPVLVYPLFKRFTYYPQIWLSLWFSWGAVMGFPAMGLPLTDPQTLLVSSSLLASGFCWSMIYDTIYGHQDKRDDVKVGVKSTALKWGERTKPIAYRFWGAQTMTLLSAGVFAGMGPGFMVGSFVAMLRLLRMIARVDLDDPASCGRFFQRNLLNGHIIWLGAIIDYLAVLFFVAAV